MGNSKSNLSKRNINDKISLSITIIKETKAETFQLIATDRKVIGDAKFTYFKVDSSTKNLIEKNYSFCITVFNLKTKKSSKYYFNEGYKFNERSYSIKYNIINKKNFIDYSIKDYPFLKLRHNKYFEPVLIIFDENALK